MIVPGMTILVKTGEVMFEQDPKPFQAQLAGTKGELR
jgi:multidrug resistance efflux pump